MKRWERKKERKKENQYIWRTMVLNDLAHWSHLKVLFAECACCWWASLTCWNNSCRHSNWSTHWVHCIIVETDDGLVRFTSATDAVTSAISIYRESALRNSSSDSDRHVSTSVLECRQYTSFPAACWDFTSAIITVHWKMTNQNYKPFLTQIITSFSYTLTETRAYIWTATKWIHVYLKSLR